MTEHRQTSEASIEETKHTEVLFETVDDILEYYNERHKGLHETNKRMN